MGRPAYNTVILSDLHLGSETSRAREALEALRNIRFRRLILLGDILSDLNFRRLKKEHWRVLSYIRKLSNPKRGVEVVWVEGNHDVGLSLLMSHLVGVPVYQEYRWEEHGHRYLAIHGHQFDSFVVRDRLFLSSLGTYVFLLIQKFDSRTARFLDGLNTRWLRLTEKVAQGALAHARMRGVNHIFCGHTHQATSLEHHGTRYFNTGAWTNERPTYITILGQEITIHEYDGRVDHRHPDKERREVSAPLVGVAGHSRLHLDGEREPVYC